ncbi:MAG TPA: BON domain-containing protein [Usitatibacter sp.]|jgi:osmotically-inducible protein OsmY|nr:BON domain-containing protein [Usitatibacter sp.]
MILERNATRALLVGAVTALGVAGCAGWHDHTRTSSASTAEHRGVTQTASDAAITAKVKTAMAADATVKAANIDVDTVRGVVSLNGTVKDATERDRALEIARNVSGVLDVRDNLKMAG